MSRIWAVARHMIAEGVRMKIALVFIGIIVVILPVMPFAVAGDGVTVKSQVQSFLAYSLGAVGFLLSVLTVFLSCGSIANEIRQKFIFMVASKPIPRWQFFVGKWVGIATLNAGLLLLTGVTVWGFTKYLSTRPTTVPGDREALESEVLSARYGAHPEKPDMSIHVDERIRRLREEGRLENVSPAGQADLRRQIEDELNRSWSSLGPQEVKEYAFKGLLVDRTEGKWIHIQLKPKTPTGVDDLEFEVLYQAGDRNDVNTLTNEATRKMIVERVSSIEVPTHAVNADGTLYFRMANLDPKNSMMFEGDDSLMLLYDIGTFHWNLFRALAVIWCRLAFLAVLGLLASSFLSFPVACLPCFIVLFFASSAGFLMEARQWVLTEENRPMDVVWLARSGWLLSILGLAVWATHLSVGERAKLWMVLQGAAAVIFVLAIWRGAVAISANLPNTEYLVAKSVWLLFDTMVSDVMKLVPDFSQFDPVSTLVSGRVVTLLWVLQSLFVLVFIKGLIVGAVGCLVLTKRELAQVTV